MTETQNILQRIAEAGRADLEERKRNVPESVLLQQLKQRQAAKSLSASLKNGDGVRIIAELKKASPSKGVIRADFPYETIARQYLEAGATAISVLTEPHYFQGSLTYLEKMAELAAGTPVPVLRKDFIFDRYQILEARAAGADAVLLIAALIEDDDVFAGLLGLTHELGMEALCEAHTENEVSRLIRLHAGIIGVNSRDLKTFHTDIHQTAHLLQMIPSGCAAVAESGIRHAEDLKKLSADAYLIGETLMRAADPGMELRKLREGR